MKPIRRSRMEALLDRLLPEWRETGGWTYNVFCRSGSLYLDEDQPISRLHLASESVLNQLKQGPFFLFHDGIAAWKTKWRGNRGYEFTETAELLAFLKTEIYFRDPSRMEDNYNILDESGKWMLIYGHHGNWIFHASDELLLKLNQQVKADLYLAAKGK